MSSKKRDKKGRILREGERQRSDGRYEYRYTDSKGEPHSVYSWKLFENDVLPEGKRACLSLRELEVKINQDISDGIDISTSASTKLSDAFAIWISGKPKLKDATRINYKTCFNTHVSGEIGHLSVKAIKPSTIKRLYTSLQLDRGISFGTIKIIQNILHQTFDMLVQDDILRKNPTDKILKDLEINSPKKRHCLTISSQTSFVNFVQEDVRSQKWFPLILFLFSTGVRIGEAVALTWADIDFVQKIIHIKSTATKSTKPTEKGMYTIGETKTDAGTRDIPMLKSLEAILRFCYDNDMVLSRYQDISDWYIFRNTKDSFIVPESFGKILKSICIRYNRTHEDKIPVFTPHVIRHTFCVRLCEQGVNIKVVQTIMGHSSSQITMDVYNEATLEARQSTFQELDKMESANLPKFVPILIEKI